LPEETVIGLQGLDRPVYRKFAATAQVGLNVHLLLLSMWHATEVRPQRMAESLPRTPSLHALLSSALLKAWRRADDGHQIASRATSCESFTGSGELTAKRSCEAQRHNAQRNGSRQLLSGYLIPIK
jgi:hypothetical protein